MDKYQSLTSSVLTDIAEVRRAEKGKIYPKGTVYVQVSACNKSSKDSWMILEDPGCLEDKYACAIPNIDIDPDYFRIALEEATPEWFAKYVGTNINISMDAFKYFVVRYTENKEQQEKCVEMIRTIEKEIALILEGISVYKDIKEWYLSKMLV